MATIKNFEDLEVWQKARILCKKVFELMQKESFSKDYELKNQISRSSGSTMDNIAEGFERGGNREFIQFLGFAKGSAGEVRSQLYRAKDRNHINEAEFKETYALADEVGKMISGLTKYLLKSDIKGHKFNNDSKL
jgi:four helix bundle protein